jgi:DNA end-binding protein Ku
MAEADKVAIARVVIRSKENLVALRSYNGAITMETMLFPDEVVQPDSIEELAASDGNLKTTKRELDMAKQLIESLSGDFDPSGYRDEYRERVLDLIERKAAGETITVEAPEPERKEVPDLMAALEASIAASKSPPKKRARSTNGSGASKKKKAAAKK